MKKKPTTLFIVNPVAGGKLRKKEWEKFWPTLVDQLGEGNYEYTEHPRDGESLAVKGVAQGYQRIIAVGGDGTLNECVNGLMQHSAEKRKSICLGVFPFGRGCDFARGLKISRDPHEALQMFKRANVAPVDVGRIQCLNGDGKRKTTYFINIANVGIVGNVDMWSHKSPRIFGATAAYIFGAIFGALEFRGEEVEVLAQGKHIQRNIFNIIIANGAFFGSGMKAAPHAKIDDGLFEIIIAPNASVFQFAKNFPKLYQGKHLDVDGVDYFRSSKLKVLPGHGPSHLLVEMDGDVVGSLPATFEVVPEAINFISPALP